MHSKPRGPGSIQARAATQTMLSRPPSAVGMDIGDYMGANPAFDGRCVRLNLRGGFDISVYDITTSTGLEQEAVTGPCIAINVMLEGNGSAVVGSPDTRGIGVPYRDRTLYVCLMHKGLQSRMRLPAGQSLRGLDIRLSLEFFAQQALKPDIRTLGAAHDWHHSSGPDFWIGIAQGTRQILENAEYVCAEIFREQANDLAMECRVLGIVTEIFTALDKRGPALPLLTKRQLRLLENAHTLLQDDLSRSWSIRELARRCGLNEKSLKQGFKQRYGVPVYQFLQTLRLNRARQLLDAGTMSIAEISVAVGYANPSHFAYLFKREFGFAPSRLLRGS